MQIVSLGTQHTACLSAIHSAALPAQRWGADVFKNYLTNPAYGNITLLGAFENDELLGFILARTTCGESEIITFAVEPCYQNKGVGAALLSHLCAYISHPLFLEVAQSNVRAIHLYQGMGFSIVGRRPGYYTTPGGTCEDGWIMRRG
jgi:ribosomal-protein-alanine acetyltransferase